MRRLVSGLLSFALLASPSLSWAATVSANLAITVTPAGNVIQASNYCAANGGGNGTTGSPWQAACIQAAINAAANGDTVSLAAGNWQLQISQAPVITGNKSVNLVGAGSGNTFDYLGHPNNGSGGPVGTVTRVYTSGTMGHGGGYITFGNYNALGSTTGCAGGTPAPSISHIYFDGSLSQSVTAWGENGDYNGTINLQSCKNATLNDIRVLHVQSSVCPGGCANAQFFIRDSNNVTVENSVVAMSQSGGNYGTGIPFQYQELNTATINNNIFYAGYPNPIYVDNQTYTSNFLFMGCDSIACSSVVPGYGDTGCNNQGCVANGGTTGSFHFYVRNNLFQNTSNTDFGGDFAIGGGLNDPQTNGIVNDLQFSGNWMNTIEGFISACQWRIPTYGWTSCLSNAIGSPGMQVNTYSATNNSVIGATSANIDFRGNGCPAAGGFDVGTGADCSGGSTKNMQCVNCSASQNYMSSPSDQYYSDANTISASVSGNFCSGSSGGGWCTTTGFSSLPTAAFTLGTVSGGLVPFATATFTAQYGAVKWLASLSATTPTSGDSRWSYLPPATLAAASSNTVYLWTMDSANHISTAASHVVP